MNIRRGMWRLWVVLSVLYVLFTGIVSYQEIRAEFARATPAGDWLDQFTVLPTKCEPESRGLKTVDYEQKGGLCWYPLEKFRALYPEYEDMGNRALANTLFAKVGQPLEPAHPWLLIGQRAAVALGVPLAVLSIGWSLLWAISGFRQDVAR
jgi:hypothetical protein